MQSLKQQCVWAELSSAAKPPCRMGQVSLSSWEVGSASLCLSRASVSCCLPKLTIWLRVMQIAKCLCFVHGGLEVLTTRWLLPECAFRLGLLLPLVVPGVQSWELDSSSGARSKQPRRQTRLLKDQTSVWKSGLQMGEGLRQESKGMGDFPDSQTLRKISQQNGPKHKQLTPDMQYLL